MNSNKLKKSVVTNDDDILVVVQKLFKRKLDTKASKFKTKASFNLTVAFFVRARIATPPPVFIIQATPVDNCIRGRLKLIRHTATPKFEGGTDDRSNYELMALQAPESSLH